MAGNRIFGPTCQAKNWFADPVTDGTSALIAAPIPGVTGRESVQVHAGFWLPPLHFEVLGHAQGEFAEFEQRVLNTHIMRAERRHGKAAAEIAESDLETVEGKFKLRSAAAAKCRDLLQKARIDLKAAMEKGSAKKDISFGLTSAYRGPEYDKHLWLQYFQSKYYQAWTAKVQGHFYYGEKSLERIVEAAAEDLVAYIAPRKAAPGYSNHTRGIAVDFWTKESGQMHQAATGKNNAGLQKANEAWEATWLYRWLEDHKKAYGVDRIPSEAWHWEFK